MNDLGVIQNSPEWFRARLGMVTSTKVSAIVTKRKRGEGELSARKNMKIELLSEILMGRTPEHYVSPAMDWGTENEPRAKAEYELYTGMSVEPVGLLMHPELTRAAASPDGHIAPEGLLEVKCPNSTTHLEYIMAGITPEEYKPQMFWHMACAGPEIKWVDFVSYDPRLADEFQLFICRLERDDKVIAEMETEVEQFISEVNAMALRLQQYASDAAKGFERKIRKGQTEAELMRELAKELVP